MRIKRKLTMSKYSMITKYFYNLKKQSNLIYLFIRFKKVSPYLEFFSSLYQKIKNTNKIYL